METYRYALSITSQFYFCGIPFRLDVAPRCMLNCLYCFAISRGGRRTSNNKLSANSTHVSRKIERAMLKETSKLDVNGEMLKHKVPIHFGGISDPFSNIDTSRTAKELLNIIAEYDYPIVISTKNTQELMKDNTIKILKKIKHLAIQISITTSNEMAAKIIEPNVPSPIERVKCLKMLSEEGIHTIVRLQPLFVPWIDEIIEDLIPMLGSVGCKHIIVEYLKLPVERNISSINNMFNAIGWKGYGFYKRNNALLVGREWILPTDYKWKNLQPMINVIHQHGMTYGAGDYGLNHLGDADCCCGIDKLDGFSNWFKGNFSNVIRHSHSNYIRFDEVTKHWFPMKSIAMFMNSNCRLLNGNTVLDYMKVKWNTPGTPNAPDSFLGVSWEGEYDGKGNCVYFKDNI